MDAVTIERSVELDAPAWQVWAATRSPVAFRYVTRGILTITGLPRTTRFEHGARVEGWLLLAGVVPLHRHHLEVVRVDHAEMTLSSREHGGVLRRWDHDIVIEPLAAGRCRYTDRVAIDAGPFTLPVVAFAWWFYRVRQRRWMRLVTHAEDLELGGIDRAGEPTRGRGGRVQAPWRSGTTAPRSARSASRCSGVMPRRGR